MNEKEMSTESHSTMIKEILSLRYRPSLETTKRKFTPDDFVPQTHIDYLENIEKSILSNIENSVKEKKVAVALSGRVDSTLAISLLRKALPGLLEIIAQTKEMIHILWQL